MSRTQVETLVGELAREWGMPELALDENDFFCIQTEDGVVVNTDYFEEEEVFSLYTTVAELPAENKTEIYRVMLLANDGWNETGGATLAVDSTESLALLTVSFPVNVDLPTMLARISSFAKLAWYWSNRIKALTEVEQDVSN